MNTHSRFLRVCGRHAHMVLCACVALLAAGCAHMDESPASPTKIAAQQIQLTSDIRLARGEWPEAQWWRKYGDRQLDGLISQALKDAPAMALAKARVEASHAQANLAEAHGGLLVGLTASFDQQTVSENGFLGPFSHNVPSLGATGPRYTAGTVGIGARYEFDPWGKDKSRVDAAIGMHHARQAEAAQVELVLSTAVAQTYFNMQALFAAQKLLEQGRDMETDLVAAHAARAQRGLEPLTQLEATKAQLLEIERQLGATQSKIKSQREALRALVGAGPGNLAPISPMELPATAGAIPQSLGFELLARRPDLQAMQWYLQASMSQVEVAKAAFYPSFDIKAFFGFDALHLNDLFNQSSRQFNIIPGLSLPIFDSGRLNAGLKSAQAQSHAMVAEYNQSVLSAIREVAQDGIELEELSHQVDLQNARTNAVTFARNSAQAQFDRGLGDKLALCQASLPVLAEEGRRLELRRLQVSAEISMTKALGGGYYSGIATTGGTSKEEPHAAR